MKTRHVALIGAILLRRRSPRRSTGSTNRIRGYSSSSR
jgi:hypothetical protein